MGWHNVAAGGVRTADSRHAGHAGAQGNNPKCHVCRKLKSKCRCDHFCNGHTHKAA